MGLNNRLSKLYGELRDTMTFDQQTWKAACPVGSWIRLAGSNHHAGQYGIVTEYYTDNWIYLDLVGKRSVTHGLWSPLKDVLPTEPPEEIKERYLIYILSKK